jgi:micrococcal nuclease
MFIPPKHRRKNHGSTPLIILFLLIITVLIASFQIQKQNHNSSQETRSVAVKPTVSASPTGTSTYDRILIVKVIDGDTIELTNQERVRLIGIDTPETKHNEKSKRDEKRSGVTADKIIALGKASKDFTTEIALNRHARIEFDAGKHDKYGRLLGYVFIFDEKSNKEIFLNAAIIESGYALPLTIPPNIKYAEEFHELYLQARAHNRGLWEDAAIARQYR